MTTIKPHAVKLLKAAEHMDWTQVVPQKDRHGSKCRSKPPFEHFIKTGE